MSNCNSCNDDDGLNEIMTDNALPLNQIPCHPPIVYVAPSPGRETCITPDRSNPCGNICSHCNGYCNGACTYRVTPHYAQPQMCPENNKQIIYNNTYSASIKNKDAFNMPACDQTATVVFPGLKQIALFSRIWAYGYGYLTVIAFNSETSAVTLRNDCNSVECSDSQAPVGTAIPACTQFIISPASCTTDSGGSGGVSSAYPYLAAQFTAPPAEPAIGSCINVQVTNTNGLSVGKLVQIAGGTYLLQAILSSTLITICNQGQGVTSGTTVQAQAGGVYITPVVLVDTNPCTNTPVASGALMVCKDNLQQPLLGTATGQVPVYDVDTGEVNFRDLLIPVGDCTNLTVCFTVDPALPFATTSYLVTVVNTAIFAVSDVVVIQGTAFTITAILNATQMRIQPIAVPTAIQTYPVGAAVCDADCCTELDFRVTTLETQIAPLVDPCTIDVGAVQRAQDVSSGAGVPSSINVIGISADGDTAELVITNTSTCKAIQGYAILSWEWDGEVEGTDGQFATIAYSQVSGQVTGLIGSTVTPAINVGIVTHDTVGINGGAGALIRRQGETAMLTGAFVIPPGNELRLASAARVTLQAASAGVIMRHTLKQARITFYGLAI